MEATLTSKGQITIPKAIRDGLDLRNGDKIVFDPLDDGSYVLRPKATDVKILKGALGYDGPVISLQEMDQAIAENVKR